MRNEQKTALRNGGPVASSAPPLQGLVGSAHAEITRIRRATGSCGQNTAAVAVFTLAGSFDSVAAGCLPWSGSTELLAPSLRLSWGALFPAITSRGVGLVPG